MTDHNTQETRNRAVLVGLNADSLPREDNASETTLEELAALMKQQAEKRFAPMVQTAPAPENETDNRAFCI